MKPASGSPRTSASRAESSYLFFHMPRAKTNYLQLSMVDQKRCEASLHSQLFHLCWHTPNSENLGNTPTKSLWRPHLPSIRSGHAPCPFHRASCPVSDGALLRLHPKHPHPSGVPPRSDPDRTDGRTVPQGHAVWSSDQLMSEAICRPCEGTVDRATARFGFP